MIICDSSSLIALNETCNFQAIHFLSDSNFVIPPQVEAEIITAPLKIKRFEMAALRLKSIIKEKSIRVISKPALAEVTEKVMQLANNTYFLENKPLTLIQEGEAACIALLSLLKTELLLVDEKTTRMLIEDPTALQKIIQEEHGRKVKINSDNLKKFQGFVDGVAVMRSTELVTIAARKGFFSRFEEDEKTAFHAAIHSLRFAGCSISSQEIEEYEEMDISPPYPRG